MLPLACSSARSNPAKRTTMSNSGTHTLCVAGACRQPLFSMLKLGVQSTVAKSTNECLRMRSTHSFSGSMLTACRISDNWVEQHASSQFCGLTRASLLHGFYFDFRCAYRRTSRLECCALSSISVSAVHSYSSDDRMTVYSSV